MRKREYILKRKEKEKMIGPGFRGQAFNGCQIVQHKCCGRYDIYQFPINGHFNLEGSLKENTEIAERHKCVLCLNGRR